MSSTTVSSDRLDFQRATQKEQLSDRDIELVHRYLSDPTVFPREFKQWITEHTSDTVDIAKTQVHGLVNTSGQVVIGGASMAILGASLVGCLMPYAGALAPDGWLLCDGREVLRADYATLFALVGTTWGAPSGVDKFVLPDLRGRTPFGVDGNVPFAGHDPNPAGARGPKHYHRFLDTKSFAAGGPNTLYGGTDWEGDHSHGVTDTAPGYTSFQGGTQGQIKALSDYAYDIGRGTGGNGGHDHGVSVNGYVNVTGSVTMDAFTDGGAVGPKDAVGWVGLNWIMGSGKLP